MASLTWYHRLVCIPRGFAIGVGVGCSFDEPVHDLLGLGGDEFQDLYHFTVGDTVGQAFHPGHSVAYPPMSLISFALDVAVALVLGVAIGAERQLHRHPAGLRTNALVCVGAALFVSLPRWIGGVEDPTRMASMVVSGLGFLGGGVILREGLSVKGLNTAATLWCSGAVGALAGAGFPLPALIGTVLILGINLGLRQPSLWIDAGRASATDAEICYRLRVECEENQGASIRTVLLRYIGDHDRMTFFLMNYPRERRRAAAAEFENSLRDFPFGCV